MKSSLEPIYRDLCVSTLGIKAMLLQNIDRQIVLQVRDQHLAEKMLMYYKKYVGSRLRKETAANVFFDVKINFT